MAEPSESPLITPSSNESCLQQHEESQLRFRKRSERASKPRIAAIISGSLSKLMSNSTGAYEVWEHTRTLAEHVFDPLSQDAIVHSFLCLNVNDLAPPHIVMRQLHIVRILQNLTGTAADTWPKGQPLSATVSLFAQISRMGQCYWQALEYEAQRAESYAWFLRLRPDLLFFADVPPLWSYSSSHVSVRARSLHGGKYARRHPISVTLEYFAVVRQGCEKNPSCTESAAPLPCLVPDDTFAVMPRHLASRYFLFTHGKEEAPLTIHNTSDAAGCRRPYHSEWGNRTECHQCLKCQRRYCQEFLFAENWFAARLPFELRAFRARIHPGLAAYSRGICSPFAEVCNKTLLSERYNNLPLSC